MILDVQFDDGILSILMTNIGDSAATNVSTALDKKIVGLGGTREINGLNILKEITFFPPHKTFTFLLDSASSYFGEKGTHEVHGDHIVLGQRREGLQREDHPRPRNLQGPALSNRRQRTPNTSKLTNQLGALFARRAFLDSRSHTRPSLAQSRLPPSCYNLEDILAKPYTIPESRFIHAKGR